MRSVLPVFVFAAGLILSHGAARAQVLYGSIIGVITDQSGAVLSLMDVAQDITGRIELYDTDVRIAVPGSNAHTACIFYNREFFCYTLITFIVLTVVAENSVLFIRKARMAAFKIFTIKMYAREFHAGEFSILFFLLVKTLK